MVPLSGGRRHSVVPLIRGIQGGWRVSLSKGAVPRKGTPSPWHTFPLTLALSHGGERGLEERELWVPPGARRTCDFLSLDGRGVR